MSTVALILWFVRWLIKTGKEDHEVLGLAIPILTALHPVLRGDASWISSLQRLLTRSAKAEEKDSENGGESPA